MIHRLLAHLLVAQCLLIFNKVLGASPPLQSDGDFFKGRCRGSNCQFDIDATNLLQTSSSIVYPAPQENGRTGNLSFVHVPTNFGFDVEAVALGEGSVNSTMRGILQSEELDDIAETEAIIKKIVQSGGQIWGEMDPKLRVISNITQCDLYLTPPKYWPAQIASRYFGNSIPFGIIRNPYDKLVYEFRLQASGLESTFLGQSRSDIVTRENDTDAGSATYEHYFATCDVNSWLHAELTKYLSGQHFHHNCHFIPQAEYFDQPHGIALAIDAGKLPASFNQAMAAYGYAFRITELMAPSTCRNVWAGSLTAATKRLVKQAYMVDFRLLCQYFNQCDFDALVCPPSNTGTCGRSTHECSTPGLLLVLFVLAHTWLRFSGCDLI